MTARPLAETLRGRFVTFEGIDGCGKTTQARLLAETLRHQGVAVLETREPGGTPVGKALRAVLLSKQHSALVPLAESLLFLADRIQHLDELIRPALARGDVVICDRYHDATLAYQGYARNVNLSLLAPVISATIASTPPDVTFWLDMEVEVAWQRSGNRPPHILSGEEEAEIVARQEDFSGKQLTLWLDQHRLDDSSMEFHERVREGYRRLAEQFPERIVRVDAAQPVEAVQQAIWRVLLQRLGG